MDAMDVVPLRELDAARRSGADRAPPRADAGRRTTRRCPSRSTTRWPARPAPAPRRTTRGLVAGRPRRRASPASPLLTPATDGSTRDPRRRRSSRPARRRAGRRARRRGRRAGRGQEGAGALHLWAMQAGPADDDLARRHGFAPERDLLQMRVPLPLPDDVLRATRPVLTRPFVPGQDDDAWLDGQQPRLRRPPRTGSWTMRPAARADGGRVGRPGRVSRRRRPRRRTASSASAGPRSTGPAPRCSARST